uniref:Uncharacterized protein n=1 Tax=Arundo donax TaxID=35708 RepID=A0A0A9BDQ8_ARUDO
MWLRKMVGMMKLLHQMILLQIKMLMLIQKRIVLVIAQMLRMKMMTPCLIMFLILISMILTRIVLRNLFRVIKSGLLMMTKMACLVIMHLFRKFFP